MFEQQVHHSDCHCDSNSYRDCHNDCVGANGTVTLTDSLWDQHFKAFAQPSMSFKLLFHAHTAQWSGSVRCAIGPEDSANEAGL